MKSSIKTLALITLSCGLWTACQRNSPSNSPETDPLYNKLKAMSVDLPNGWSLTPIGRSVELDDLPLNLIVSPNKKLLAVTNNGQSVQSIMLIDAQTEKVLHQQIIDKAYVGLAFSQSGERLYASAGNDNRILEYKIESNKLVKVDSIVLGKPWPNKISPTGICLDDAQSRMYVVTKEDSSLYVCNTQTREVSSKIKLASEAYGCMLSPTGKEVYISLWGGSAVCIYDVATGKIDQKIATDKNPNDMALTKDGKFLYVAHGNDNSVSVIDVAARKVAERLTTSLYPDAPVGSTPNGVSLSEDENTLWIANADNNCLAVFDVSVKGRSKSKGFIPTGWYPTAVKNIGDRLFITNGKGFSSKANPKGPNPSLAKVPMDKGANPQAYTGREQYIGGLFQGTMSIIDLPNETTLATYSRLVYSNSPYTKEKELQTEGEKGNPIPMRVGDASPIKHVFYIVKENRTYDQVLGDMKEGNGDASLCLFPEKITPNQHALAREFVLLDNFYVDAEVSADGHNWSSAAYANDYVEKNWVTSYGGRGGTYDFEGSREIAHPRDGFIWDHCLRAGVSYRTYGWFVKGKEASIPALRSNFCPDFKGYDLGYLDVDRVAAWKSDFDSLLAIGKVPALSTIRLGNDHTSGASVGKPTPFAAVADNDLAVGRLVEHLSKSSIWKESVVFILEDDAQNGPDHVDAHRSIAFVAGGFVKRNFVDHTMYSTSGMLRTIELILGLKPMSQYDAAATPMWRCFQAQPNTKPFTAMAPGVDLYQKNVAVNKNSRRSDSFDLSIPDAIDDYVFSEIVWQTVRGENSIMPAPRRGAFVKLEKKDEDEDDD
ncbi:bifunctional YncE family protein/alkaline phosphatase family protein [Dyadobacter tibetensis]|uniref:bifunctional YncE family protein/alkaline phosphatase family protein n=1 Tax=Dyadobacter tibetensis TaxID=1211851 RepID=UPI00046F0FFF|nr:bifunctional YncE family protein/alkaline phosphatase family protein [Dyadobacter tibetensis]